VAPMAVASPSSPQTLDPNADSSDAGNVPSSAPADPSSAPPRAPGENPASNPPNPIPSPSPVAPPPPAVPSFAPSFRPLGAPPVPHYSAVPNPMAQNPTFQAPGIQPPGVPAPALIMPPGAASGGPPARLGVPYPVPGQPMPYGQVGNGYMAVPTPQGPMGMPPPGMPRYPAPYPTMIRPGFPPRPIPPAGVIPQIPRPPIPSIRGVPPVVTPVIRAMIPIVAPAEKPQTTVYVGKIAATVENEFLLSILTVCYLNINQATREYLERYVERKREKIKEAETGGPAKESNIKDGSETQVPTKPVEEGTKKDSEDSGDKENQDSSKKFGIVTDEDREADRETLEKLTNMIEERLKNKPLPPPPVDGSAKLTCEVGSKLRDGDSDVDVVRSDAAEDKNDDETTSENKPGTESDKPETSSPDKSRRHDRSRERDRERDLKRDKERELERVERERERERVRRDRERELKVREAERLYKDRLKEWESREREKEYQRQYEKEREKERERERRREILRQEEESSGDDDDDSRKRRRRSVILEERRRKRQREKEEDLDDRSKEEEEITEAKRRAVEEQQLKLDSRSPGQMILEDENPIVQEQNVVEVKQIASVQANEVSGNTINNG
ncbi:hypothetical protein BHM03_00051282, partial [Ensete ventricosum]